MGVFGLGGLGYLGAKGLGDFWVTVWGLRFRVWGSGASQVLNVDPQRKERS